jgi:predicted extracellular nuclease
MTDQYKVQGDSPGSSSRSADLGQQAKKLTGDLKNKASQFGDTATRLAKDQAAELGEAAKDMASDATARVKTALERQKTSSADYLGTIAQAVHRAAGEFQDEAPQAAHYIRQAADQIETVATAVRERNVRDLIGEVQGFARRQPTLFFGGAVVLGFAALRFLKSSAPSSRDNPTAQPTPQNLLTEGNRPHQWNAG